MAGPPLILNSATAHSRLIKLAQQAAIAIPYYQEHFASVDFAQADLPVAALPLLTKEMVRQHQKEMVRPDFHQEQTNIDVAYTSGSTGIPLRLTRKRTEMIRAAKNVWQARQTIFPDLLSTCGVMINNRLQPTRSEVGKNMRLHGRKGLLLETTFDYSPEHIHPYLDELDYYQPRWLSGPPALLSLLAEGIRTEKRPLKTPLAFVESHSSLLTEEDRAILAATFDCPVVNHYGCEETQTIAYECPQGQLHLFDDCVLVELHPRAIAGEYELVVSSLLFEVMPFIRYQLGDILYYQASQCSCGNPHAVLGKVRGRVNDLITGTALSGTYVFHTIIKRIIAAIGHDIIRQYQVQQEAINDFAVYLKLSDPAMLPEVSTRFKDAGAGLLPQAHFSFIPVTQIDLPPTGKLQIFVPYIQ